MTFYAATLIELLIIEIFVFSIWARVLFDAVQDREGSLTSKKLTMTSLGLVFSSVAVAGIMGVRINELFTNTPSMWGITACYVLLAVSGVMFMVSAALGKNTKLLKWFIAISLVWTCIAVYLSHK